MRPYEARWEQAEGNGGRKRKGGGWVIKVAIRGKLDVRGTSANVMLRHIAMILEVWK